MDWKQTYYYNLQMWLFEPAEESLYFLRDLLEWIHDGAKKHKRLLNIWLEVVMLLQSTAM